MSYPEQPASAGEGRGTVSCTICAAVYAPSDSHEYFLQAPSMALESAFMSMCHFCFRCRRPACPGCWDDVHNVCGECVQEANLSFRTETSPLSGMLFPPLRQAPSVRERPLPAPLVCVRAGRFQLDLPPVNLALAEPVKTAMAKPEPEKKSEEPQEQKQEVLVLKPSQEEDVDEDDTAVKQELSFGRRIERIVTIAMLTIVIFIAVLIVVAEFSAQANTFIAQILHIDIQNEIAYLLQLIRQLH